MPPETKRKTQSSPNYNGLKPASAKASSAARGASRKRDTRCEVLLRKALWRLGVRYRVAVSGLPGKPDVMMKKYQLVVFIDGDFWHGRDLEARLARLAVGHNAAYWVQKIQRNVERDRRHDEDLRVAGWTVVRLWEKDILRDPAAAAAGILKVLQSKGYPPGHRLGSWPRCGRRRTIAAVGLAIDREQATIRFGQALVLARSDGPLPEEWLERTRQVSKAKNITFTPVLGTALLAKATEDAVDALSLREDEGSKGYSARSLAKGVLVPCCARAGIDLRSKGPEPLNNQPFLRAARVSVELKVKSKKAVADLAYLCETLQRADRLVGHAAIEALAAFLRVRIAASGKATTIELGSSVLDFSQLQAALAGYLAGDGEGGKVGRAIAAAALDLVFAKVQTRKINGPSNKWPGDVGAFDGKVQILSAEVKQRPFAEEEILLFAKRLQEAELQRGFIVALRQGAAALDMAQIAFQARRLYAVELFFFDDRSLLAEVVKFAPGDIRLSLARFPRQALARMEELEVSTTRLREWAALFATPSWPPPSEV